MMKRPPIWVLSVLFLLWLFFFNQGVQGEEESPPLIQLAAIQMTFQLEDFWSREAFTEKMHQLMEMTAEKLDPTLPSLVVFPEDVGLMLVVQGMEKELAEASTIAQAIEQATRAHFFSVVWIRLRRRVTWVPALYLHRHQSIAETYFQVFSNLAREYQTYLVAGSVILPPYAVVEGQVDWQQPLAYQLHNTAYLFDPQGHVVGKQDKVYLIDLEQEEALDLTPGDLENLQVLETGVGKIGIAICLDAFRDSVVDSLVAQGAEILVQPSANPGPWHRDQQLSWMESAYRRTFSQQKFVYGVNPMLNGPLWEINFFGQSSIVAQDADLTTEKGYLDLPKEPGFLALSRTHDEEEVLVVTVPHPSW